MAAADDRCRRSSQGTGSVCWGSCSTAPTEDSSCPRCRPRRGPECGCSSWRCQLRSPQNPKLLPVGTAPPGSAEHTRIGLAQLPAFPRGTVSVGALQTPKPSFGRHPTPISAPRSSGAAPPRVRLIGHIEARKGSPPPLRLRPVEPRRSRAGGEAVAGLGPRLRRTAWPEPPPGLGGEPAAVGRGGHPEVGGWRDRRRVSWHSGTSGGPTPHATVV